MSEPFAKLFDTPHGQLLVYRGEDGSGDPCLHVIGAYVEGIRPAAKLGWPEEDWQKADEAFAKVGQPEADEYAASLHAAIVGLAA